MVFDADYAAAEAVDVIPTDVYSLKPWAEPYTNRRVNGRIAKGRRKASVITSSFNMKDDYHQYYLLDLAYGSFILAQIPQNDVLLWSGAIRFFCQSGEKRMFWGCCRSVLFDSRCYGDGWA